MGCRCKQLGELEGLPHHPGTQHIPAGLHQHVRVRRYGIFDVSCWRGYDLDMTAAHPKDSMGSSGGAGLSGDQEGSPSAMQAATRATRLPCRRQALSRELI